jgi:hypothetical protein
METEIYLMITDTTGKQYPYKVDEHGVKIENFLVTEDDHNLDLIQDALENRKTIRISHRVLRTETIIEISIHKMPKGAY